MLINYNYTHGLFIAANQLADQFMTTWLMTVYNGYNGWFIMIAIGLIIMATILALVASRDISMKPVVSCRPLLMVRIPYSCLKLAMLVGP